ncbi:expressed unknown protein [Seminavis robusta]|uniref:Uncharacterized protein n=1 Tax=Seminavis robusta TaxID=568900 RepID=A0A9N8E180_9STRA|nr:expressed unknown protein [Seminavis robusta]|eukprot:Sro446_g144641.1  (183) ;mRNA; r:16017-16565
MIEWEKDNNMIEYDLSATASVNLAIVEEVFENFGGLLLAISSFWAFGGSILALVSIVFTALSAIMETGRYIGVRARMRLCREQQTASTTSSGMKAIHDASDTKAAEGLVRRNLTLLLRFRRTILRPEGCKDVLCMCEWQRKRTSSSYNDIPVHLHLQQTPETEYMHLQLFLYLNQRRINGLG